jgi:hypothetical protein
VNKSACGKRSEAAAFQSPLSTESCPIGRSGVTIDLRQDSRRDLFDASVAINTLHPTQALNSTPKTFSHEALILNTARLDAILLITASRGGPVRINLQDDAQLRHRVSSPQREQGEDLFIIKLSSVRLISQGRWVKALTDDVTTHSESRSNELHQELPTSRSEEQNLTPRANLCLTC